MNDSVIKVKNLIKLYKLYDKPIDRLKESLSIFHKKYHKEHYALDHIDFEVRSGETVGIIGTNGAGKSTLLKIITGVLSATSGEIQVNGKIASLLELGAGFNPEYTGLENIYLNGTMMGFTKEQMKERLKGIIEFADIGEFLNQPVKTYSSGMFARLAFAVAINVEPDILIIDEALSVGDIFFQNKCFKKLEELKEKDITILFVSHDMASIRQLCSRVLWIDRGKQVIFGDKEKVCSMYMNEQFKARNNTVDDSLSQGIKVLSQETLTSNDAVSYPKIMSTSDSILTDEVELVSFFITDEKGQITKEMTTCHEYTFHIVGKFNIDIDHIIMGCVIENNKGINLISLNTYICNNEYTISAKKGEIIEAKIKVLLPKLLKGQYLISPAIAKGTQLNHKIITWLHNLTNVVIYNEGYNLSLIEIPSETYICKFHSESVSYYE